MSKSPKEMKQTISDIKLIRAMMLAANQAGYKHEKNKADRSWSANTRIDNLQDVLRLFRKEMADRKQDKLSNQDRNLSKEIQGEIRWAFRNLCRKRKFNETVIVGAKDRAGTCEYTKGYGKAEVKFYVGHLWHQRVYSNLMINDRFLNSDDYIILAATEYRVNVPSIRLWFASVFSIKEKATRQGWIGQSDLGNKQCAFRQDQMAAIKFAKELAAREINSKLGETSNA